MFGFSTLFMYLVPFSLMNGVSPCFVGSLLLNANQQHTFGRELWTATNWWWSLSWILRPSVCTCGPLWLSFQLAPLIPRFTFAVFLSAADCLSWRGHLALNSLSSDIMTSSKRLAHLLLSEVKILACFSLQGQIRLATCIMTNFPAKNLSVTVFFSLFVCVCVLLQAGIINQLSKRFP